MKGGLTIMEVDASNLPDFNRLIKLQNQPSIVKFHAPWCGHCKTLNPKWSEMVAQLDRSKLRGLLASVSEKYKDDVECDSTIEGYPTIREFMGGNKKKDYNGGREADDLAKYVNGVLKNKGQQGGQRKKKRRKRKKTRKHKTKRRRRKKRRRKTRKKRYRGRGGFRERFYKMISTKYV